MRIAPRPVILLDLDGVLFETRRFAEDLAGALQAAFGIDPSDFRLEYPDYYAYHDEMRHYDFFRHMAAYGLEPDNVERSVREYLAGRDYAYPDVAAFLRFAKPLTDELSVLTHGEHRYQYLKYTLAPVFGRLPFHDVLTHKRAFITKHYAGGHGILIDDHKVGTLPDGFGHVWLSRYGSAGAYGSLDEIRRDWPDLRIGA